MTIHHYAKYILAAYLTTNSLYLLYSFLKFFCYLKESISLLTFLILVVVNCSSLSSSWDYMDYSSPSSFVQGISQARTMSQLPFPSPADLILPTQGWNLGLLHFRWILYLRFSSCLSCFGFVVLLINELILFQNFWKMSELTLLIIFMLQFFSLPSFPF